MHDRYWLPGSVSVRAQLGIRAEDPNIFRTYTLAEAIRCAKVLSADRNISLFVRALLPVGLCLDLRPGHISATIASIAQACGMGARTVRQHTGCDPWRSGRGGVPDRGSVLQAATRPSGA